MDLNTLRTLADSSTLTSDHQRALWFDLHGNWDAAHKIVQALEDADAMWIHAYLHRKEPDISNARYWYRSAGKPYPAGQSFDDEAALILQTIR